MTPAILRTTDVALIVPEQWGSSADDAIAAGAVRVSLNEILSRFSQSEPVSDLRLIGEVGEPSEIAVLGKIGGIDLSLIVRDPDGQERYRLKSQQGWIYGIFGKARFSTVCVVIDGIAVPIDLGALP